MSKNTSEYKGLFQPFLEEEQIDGVVHTPQELAEFMARSVIDNYLESHKEIKWLESLEKLSSSETYNTETIDICQRLYEHLSEITICDPACGYGALLLACAEYLYSLKQMIRKYLHNHTNPIKTIASRRIKLEVLSQLYGVEIQAKSVGKCRKLLAQWAKWSNSHFHDSKMDQIKRGNALWGFGSLEEIKQATHRGLYEFLSTPEQEICEQLKHGEKISESAKNVLNKFFLKQQRTLLKFNENEIDTPFHWPVEFPEIISKGGFSIIISNPPYIRHEKIKKTIKESLYTFYDYWFFKDMNIPFPRKSDVAMLFLLRSYSILQPDGWFVDLVSNTWLRTEYAYGYRYFLQKNTTLECLLNFDNTRLFSVNVLTLIMCLQKRKPPLTHKIKYLYEPTTLDIKKEDIIHYPQHKLDPHLWGFFTETTQEIMDYIGQFPSIKERDYEVYRGYQTGFAGAFIVDSSSKNNILASEPQSKKFFWPVLRGRFFDKYSFEWNHEWMIHIPSGYTNKHKGSSDPYTWFSQTHPSLMTHLKSFLEIEGKRLGLIDRGSQGDYWWEGIASKVLTLFSKPKLCWQEISKPGCFCLVPPNIYVNAKLHLLCSLSVKTLKTLGCLFNSRLIEWYYDKIGIHLGDQYEWKKHRIIHLRFPSISHINLSSIYDLQTFLAYTPLDLTPDWNELINCIVYEIYFADYLRKYSSPKILPRVLKTLESLNLHTWLKLKQNQLFEEDINEKIQTQLSLKTKNLLPQVKSLLNSLLTDTTIQQRQNQLLSDKWINEIHTFNLQKEK